MQPIHSQAVPAVPVDSPLTLSGTRRQPLLALLMRLHFHVGLFVGPFIFVAALSGLLYALTPQIEDRLYADQLYTDSRGFKQSLSRQIEVARAHAGTQAAVVAVRPALVPGTTTRVIFAADAGALHSPAVFVDPVTSEVRGQLGVYGTSGVLPLRTWIDHFHRSLLLGEWGRTYSELAASWLWIAALSGLAVWIARRAQRRSGRPPQGVRRSHAVLGLWLLIGMLFFSATGLTWSRWAGDRISVARAALGMSTPGLSTSLDSTVQTRTDEHADHGGTTMTSDTGVDLSRIDLILATARDAGIDAQKIEIRPPAASDRAWTVSEIDRSWPTQVDAVAIDPHTLNVVDKIEFATFPLAAKLTRWGIDAHMGSLFGLANQLLLVAVAGGLLVMLSWGYLMWWRRQTRLAHDAAHHLLASTLRQLSVPARLGAVTLMILLGYCLPVMGASLLAFIVLEAGFHAFRRR